jgi:RNA polymerase sigma factor (sigma-70 family)
MTTTTGRRRSEVELFNALPGTTDLHAIDEYRRRVLRCVLWLLARRPSGPLVVGDVGDMADEVITRLEEYLRPREGDERARRFAGSDAQFRRYLYLTVGSVYADTVRLRLRLRSLDAPIETGDGEEMPLGQLRARLLEWPTAGEHLGRPDVQAWIEQALQRLPERSRRWLLAFHRDGVPIKEIARRSGLRRNAVEVGLGRGRCAFRVAFLDVFFATADARFRARVGEAARRLSEPHGALFRAYWTHDRDPRDAAARLGLRWDTAKALLGEAKERVWRMLPEGGPA